jgi:hypothetical protein
MNNNSNKPVNVVMDFIYKYLLPNNFEYHYICSCNIIDIEKKINEIYNIDKKQVILIGGDFNKEIKILKNKNIIALRQTFYKSTKNINDILIPSSYGCVAGDDNMTPIVPIDKPRISFTGSLYTHKSRENLFNILINDNRIICDFNLLKVNCMGLTDPKINEKINLFNNNIKNSEFTFCPRGNGNFSIRFYEALKSGRIPIILNTDNELPFEKYIDWNKICVITENEDTLINDILYFFNNNDLINIQKKCKEIFNYYFIDNFGKILYEEIDLVYNSFK